MASPNYNPQANLARLPAEIQHEISAYLSRPDHKALRGVCQSLKALATGYVFYRAHISLLKEDRDAFFNICEHPHLRDVVEQLVWYDLPSIPDDKGLIEAYNFEPMGRRGDLFLERRGELFLESERDLMEYIPRAAEVFHQAQWLTSLGINKMTSAQQYQSVDRALEVFGYKLNNAIEKMHRLHTIISQPAPGDRIIRSTEGQEFSFAISLFSQFPTSVTEEGMRIIPEVIGRALIPNIKSLYINDYAWKSLDLIKLFNYFDADAFKGLEVIDLCLNYAIGRSLLDGLAVRLQAASKLRVLKLCFENHFMNFLSHNTSRSPLFGTFDSICGNAYWKYLKTVEIVDLVLPRTSLQDFFTRHQHSLRNIKIHECDLDDMRWFLLIEHMASLPELVLDSIQISDRETGGQASSSLILASINSKEQPITNPDLIIFGNPEDLLFDQLAWPEVAIHDARKQPTKYGYPEDYFDRDSDDTKFDDDNPVFQHPKVYWVYDWMGKDIIIFYSTTDSGYANGGNTTQIWKFVYRDGSYAFSNPYAEVPDPLEYFEDWDAAEGDKVEATPYGDAFDIFRQSPKTFKDPSSIEYPPNTRVWLGDYDDKPLTQEMIKHWEQRWAENFDSGDDGDGDKKYWRGTMVYAIVRR